MSGRSAGSPDPEHLLDEQLAFYRAEAAIYERWRVEVFERGGGGEFGERCRQERNRILAQIREFSPRGQVLELAAGTAAFTPALLESADHVTALDASPESLEIARAKLSGDRGRVTLLEADVFRWRPRFRYDTVFFAFWLSHVPPGRFDAFWQLVSAALAPDGRVFLVDAAVASTNPGTSGPGRVRYRERDDLEAGVSVREVAGRRFHVVKVVWRPDALRRRLAELGWGASLRLEGRCLVGSAWRKSRSSVAASEIGGPARARR